MLLITLLLLLKAVHRRNNKIIKLLKFNSHKKLNNLNKKQTQGKTKRTRRNRTTKTQNSYGKNLEFQGIKPAKERNPRKKKKRIKTAIRNKIITNNSKNQLSKTKNLQSRSSKLISTPLNIQIKARGGFEEEGLR